MMKWIGLAVAVAIAAAPCMCLARNVARPDAAAPTSHVGAARLARQHPIARRSIAYEPHYYARPVHYRPYPYGVPAPFLLGFGPWW